MTPSRITSLGERIERRLILGGLVGTIFGGGILAGAAYLSSPEHYTPETVRALRLRHDLQYERATPGFLRDKPLDYFVQAQQDYNILLQQPEVQSGMQRADIARRAGAASGGFALLSTFSLLLGIVLQQRRLERLRADIAAYRLSEARDEKQFDERLQDPDLQEPSPTRKHELKRLD